MVRLDGDRRPAARRRGFDHVGIERPLHQEPDVARDVPRGVLEDIDERMTDTAPLLLGVLDAAQLPEEARSRIDHAQVEPEVRPERPLDLLPLVQPQQAVVHEDAREAVADRAVHQRGRHGRIHTAGKSADRLLGRTHELADAPHLVVDEVARRPIGRAAADFKQEVMEDLAAARSVGHLRVEQHAVDGL